MIGNLDLDLVVYMLGSVHDNRHWMYKGMKWNSKKELNIQLKADGVDTNSIPLSVNPSSLKRVKESVVSYVDGIIEKVDCEVFGHLSGKSNFRHDIATILPYKGNRVSDKPYHYDNIRQFLVEYYNAEVSMGYEADDAIGLNHDPEEDVIITRDKDLNVIPGLHYDWEKDSCFYVTEAEANRNFFKQMLTGDTTDNIMGLFGIGPKNVLCKKVDDMEDASDMYQLVLEEYTRRFGNYGITFFKENAKLLWILQKRDCPVL